MKSETVVLGEREFTISELPLKRNSEFRQRIQSSLQDVLPGFSLTLQRDLQNWQDIRSLAREVGPSVITAIGSFDAVLYLVLDYMFGYSKDDDIIPEEVAYVFDNAYESQIFQAFIRIMLMVFPFLTWIETGGQMVNSLAQSDGSENGQTTTNLREASGGSGRKRKRGSTK